MLDQADAESNQRLVNALFGLESEAALEKDPEIASHLQLDLDETGNPIQLRFAYVHEEYCIGCTYCASIARNTFFMEDSAGRARAFAQGADDPEVLMEAILSGMAKRQMPRNQYAVRDLSAYWPNLQWR